MTVQAANHIDIRAEVAEVQGELLFFRERILSALFETPLDAVFEAEYADWVREKSKGRLSEWQEATRRLADLLPLGPMTSSKLSRDDFRDLLFQQTPPSFFVEAGRIIWKIELFVDRTMCSAYFPHLDPAAFEVPSEIQRWLMSLPVDSTELANALCMVLRLIADSDPAFAKLVLDPETWRGIVQADPNISEEERAQRLTFIGGLAFAH